MTAPDHMFRTSKKPCIEGGIQTWSPLYAGPTRKTSTPAQASKMRLAVGAAIRSPGRLAAAVHRAGRAFDPCP